MSKFFIKKSAVRHSFIAHAEGRMGQQRTVWARFLAPPMRAALSASVPCCAHQFLQVGIARYPDPYISATQAQSSKPPRYRS